MPSRNAFFVVIIVLASCSPSTAPTPAESLANIATPSFRVPLATPPPRWVEGICAVYVNVATVPLDYQDLSDTTGRVLEATQSLNVLPDWPPGYGLQSSLGDYHRRMLDAAEAWSKGNAAAARTSAQSALASARDAGEKLDEVVRTTGITIPC
jgi:hypothetical protein